MFLEYEKKPPSQKSDVSEESEEIESVEDANLTLTENVPKLQKNSHMTSSERSSKSNDKLRQTINQFQDWLKTRYLFIGCAMRMKHNVGVGCAWKI